MSKLNVSFDLPRPYTGPAHQNRQRDTSFSKNQSTLDTSFNRTKQAHKHLSFSPTMTLAEYNQVKFNKKEQKAQLPDINMPQRVELPGYFNTPLRERQSRQKSPSPSPPKKKLGDSSFISDANNTSFVLGKMKEREEIPQNENRAKSLNKYNNFVSSGVKVGGLRRLKDLTFIAQACKRAGKTREEGRAYYSMGVLYDNMKEHSKAISFYKKFLTLCRSINDVNGEALAYNCLAVDYQLLAEEGNQEMFQQALKFHEKHRDVANLAGKFTAYINMGLLYQSQGDEKNAILCQQQALRIATELSDANSQGIAVGSLGKIGTLQLAENKTRMLAFVEKYLKVCRNLDNKQGEGDAYLKLGQILADEKNFNDGLKNYQKALEIGRDNNDNDVIEKAKLGFGITKGMATMDNYLDSMKKKFNFA